MHGEAMLCTEQQEKLKDQARDPRDRNRIRHRRGRAGASLAAKCLAFVARAIIANVPDRSLCVRVRGSMQPVEKIEDQCGDDQADEDRKAEREIHGAPQR